jgi:HSP20 family protein
MIYWRESRDPMWSEFGRIRRNLDDLARQMSLTTRSPFEPWLNTACIFPAINVVKEGNSYVLTAEIPGMDPENLEIMVAGDTLTLKGERKPEQLGEAVSYHRRERASGVFQRSLTLPSKVEPDTVKAHYSDGVLTITLPIEISAQPKQISVTTE